MTSMSESLNRTLVKLHALRVPQIANKVDFTAAFHHSMTDPAQELLTRLNVKREALVDAMKGTSPVALAEKLAMTDAYLADMWNLFNSLNGQAPVKLDRALRFDWVCYLYASKQEMMASSAGIGFELMMALHLKACLHYQLAKSTVDADYRALPEASRHLCVAAGVMNSLEQSVAGAGDMARRPSEMRSEFCAFLRKYYVGCAQQMFAARAVQSGNTLAPKLCLAAADMFVEAMSIVPPTGIEPMFNHMGFLRAVFRGLGLKLRAEALAAQTETGEAVGCARLAAGALVEQQKKSKSYDPFQPGIPKLKYIEEPFSMGVSQLISQIKGVDEAALRDNNLIYFHSVPSSAAELKEPIQGMVAVKLQPYSCPPQTSITEFTYDPTRRPSTMSRLAGSVMTALFSSFGLGETADKAAAADPKEPVPASAATTGGGAANLNSIVSSAATPTAVLSYLPPAAMPPPAAGEGSTAVKQRSDSDVARELHEELNGPPSK